MVSSGCQVLLDEPRRFIDYLLSDPKLRKQIVDKGSFNEAVEKAFRSDPTLTNILTTLKSAGEDIEICGQNIFDERGVQDLIKDNVARRRLQIKKRVKKDRPKLTGKKLAKEINRRLKISIAGQKSKVQKTKQVTIKEATRPVRIGSYKRKGKTIKGHRKTEYRNLSTQEEMLIENAIKKGKTPQETVKIYRDSGLPFRTKTSIKRHYHRHKRKTKP